MATQTPTTRIKDYNTEVFRYPSDVSLSKSQQNFVIFYINVPEGTKTSLGDEKMIGVMDTGTNSVNVANAKTAAAGAVAGGALGAAATLAMLKKFTAVGGGKIGLVNGGLAAGAGALMGGGLGSIAGEYAVAKTQYSRISDAIVLGLVNVPNVSYSVTWDDVELGTLGGVLAGGASSVDSSMGSTASDMGKLALRNAVKIPGSIKSATDLFGGFGGQGPQGAISTVSKEVANPFREQIFKQVGFRTFQFQYTFMPQSKEETENVRNIIEKFAFHMHPDLSDTGLFFKFPSQFDIEYYYKDSANPYLRKVSRCVLEKCDIKYGTDNSKFAQFMNGAPVEIFMNLTFKETEVLSKQRIKAGY